MNKYKVTKTATIKKEKKKCAVCDKKVYSKQRTSAYIIEAPTTGNVQFGDVLVSGAHKLSYRPISACSELCVDTYILQHMDDRSVLEDYVYASWIPFYSTLTIEVK
jgi:hypothetical protein